ncbi:MAG: glycosyltransferase [bacterium]|nr:glycosyltransferase [bacterium]
MSKTAVIYDKWLRSLGGGEVVACNMAKILKDEGYDVVFLCGKKVPVSQILKKLNIDMRGIKMHEVWNDEIQLKKFVNGADLFINTSFMDYSFNYAKKGIYYTHFPTKIYENIKGFIFTKYILPFAAKIFKPNEFITDKESLVVQNGRAAYILKPQNRIAFFHLKKDDVYRIEFKLFIEKFYSSFLENIDLSFQNGQIIERNFSVNHQFNILKCKFKVRSQANTLYLHINYKDNLNIAGKNQLYLLYPKVFLRSVSYPLLMVFFERINDRLRAGIFANIKNRLNSYNVTVTHSEFVKKWIFKYWKKKAKLLYPPVEMLFEKHDLKKIKKEKMICSVGRFFTLGHGKKQEVMIEAFKKIYDSGHTDWQLHLVGGLSNEPSSIELAKKLKYDAFGYPIFFHFNASRQKVEDIYLKSRIYWHAAGFGESEHENPIRFEHFGIAPVEAMSAGCIPILYNAGGLAEIIKVVGLNDKLYVFNTIDDLIKKTADYLSENSNPIEWNKLFRKLSSNFSSTAFKKNFLELIKE